MYGRPWNKQRIHLTQTVCVLSKIGITACRDVVLPSRPSVPWKLLTCQGLELRYVEFIAPAALGRPRVRGLSLACLYGDRLGKPLANWCVGLDLMGPEDTYLLEQGYASR